MSKLYELLEKIKQRPGMYLGTASITSLRMFLVGYQFARREMRLENQESESDFYKNFQPWLQQKFDVKTVNSWDKIILLYSVDEKEAFTYFFQLLDEFLKRDKTLEVDKSDTVHLPAVKA
ncbi:hypothetical protein NIES4071_67780 [Calothrix sp. NIES-4071]|nr:hypothetical protein NIES4071_67780 [Calothrix sp. NIES-4071]BAZ61056.1 hypothetical protein NIES4105_67740 [Calothrix sp. NIES-4105]